MAKAITDAQPLSIYDMTIQALKQWLLEQGEASYRAEQIYNWLYLKKVSSYEEMRNVPKALREKLVDTFQFLPLKEKMRQISKDGTVKFLLELHDGHAIETVIMRHEYGNSVCVTTQVGCRMGCTFCASTLGGLRRNLTAAEIVSQVITAQRYLDETEERVSSIVIMGIGEPFENYDEMMKFLEIVTAEEGMNIGQRHITVSTSGLVPRIYDFANAGLQVTLAISLHAPNSELRTRLMPVNRRYPFEELLAACDDYIKQTGRRISFEYALIGGINDQDEHAEQLGQLLTGMKCHVNLIPVNYVPERNFVRTSRKQIFRFKEILEKYNVNTTIRREHGSDIAAACGQLRAQHMKLAHPRQKVNMHVTES